MTTLEINALIQPLEQYMTPDQKAELEKILSIGKKWKAEGEQKKQEFREKNFRSNLKEEIKIYGHKKTKWQEENQETLEEIGYEKMGPIEKKKFEEEFIRDLILYTDYPEILKPRTKEVYSNRLKPYGLESRSNLVILQEYKLGNKGVIEISKALEETGGLKPGSTLKLSVNEIGDQGTLAIAEMLENTDGLEIRSELKLGYNNIGEDGAIALAEALEKTGGLKIGSELDLQYNHIGDNGAIAIAEALAKTGGLKLSSALYLSENNIGTNGKAALQKLKDDATSKGIHCEINF